MRTPRIALGSGTPKPSKRDLARFRVLIEPADRRRRWRVPKTVGHVLDAAPDPSGCSVRSRWYKAATGTVGILSKPCGRRTCPTCVVGNLSETVGAAWAFWNGSADWTILQDGTPLNRQREQRALGIVFRGDDAMPGALGIPVPGARVLFWPGGRVRGRVVDELLVTAVRAIPVVDSEAKDPVTWFGSVPSRLSSAQIVEAAERAGFTFQVHGGRRWEARDVTPEQNATWVALLRSA